MKIKLIKKNGEFSSYKSPILNLGIYAGKQLLKRRLYSIQDPFRPLKNHLSGS